MRDNLPCVFYYTIILKGWSRKMNKNERKYVKTTKMINRVALGIFIVAVVIFIIGLVK